MQPVDAVVVGAGHAGLSIGRALEARGIEHVIVERDRIASAWRGRWESFCLVTPNWAMALTGARYDGDDPDGYLGRDDLVAFIERYASGNTAEIREGVDVTGVSVIDGGFALDTSEGLLLTKTLIAATGAYQTSHRPPAAASIPPDVFAIDSSGYRQPAELPGGEVLIVGSGQTGMQLAEELHDAGRDVLLACGRAPWLPRRFGGRDLVWWGQETGFFDQTLADIPDPAARLYSNPLTTGHGGGHDLHYRTLHAAGVTLTGRFLGFGDGQVRFADDLATSVAWGDERYGMFIAAAERVAAERGIVMDLEPPTPFPADAAPGSAPLDRFGAVIFAGGYRPNYGTWLPWPGAFDGMGFPIQTDGGSTVVDGLFFMGVHFLRKRKSSILWGAEEDATVVADRVAGRLGALAS